MSRPSVCTSVVPGPGGSAAGSMTTSGARLLLAAEAAPGGPPASARPRQRTAAASRRRRAAKRSTRRAWQSLIPVAIKVVPRRGHRCTEAEDAQSCWTRARTRRRRLPARGPPWAAPTAASTAAAMSWTRDSGSAPPDLPGEVDLGGRGHLALAPGRRRPAPVRVGVGDRLGRTDREAPLAHVLGCVRVGDQCGVVPAHQGTVQGAADALLGLGTGDNQPADAALGEPLLEVGVLEGVGVLLVDQRLVVQPDQLGRVLPLG